jgi:hypothetical protein
VPGRPAECLVRLPRAAYATRRLTVRMCPGLRGRATDRTSGRRAAQRRLSRDRSPAPANRRLRYMHMCVWASPGRPTDPGEMPPLKGRDITCRCSTGQGSESPRALNVSYPHGSARVRILRWPPGRAAGDARAWPPTRRLGPRRRLALAISRVLSGSGGEPLASRCLIGGAVQLRVE